mgnify:CR=1 FL=1
MPFAQGARSGLSLIYETAWGTTPTTGSLTKFPYTGHSLNLTKEQIQSAAIMPDRMIRNDRHGNRQAAGDVTVEFGPVDFDPFLESAFMSSWSSNVLKVGTTVKSLTINDGIEDVGQNRIFRGMSVGSATFSITPNQMSNATFNLVGKDMITSASPARPTSTGPSNLVPFDNCSGQIQIGNAGGTLTSVATITSIELTINNDMSPAFVVGSCSAAQLEYGMATVSGTISAYFDGLELYNRFMNETETAISFTLNNPVGNRPYTFLIPRAKFNTGDMPVSGPKSRVMTVGFSAIYDATTDTVLQLTRTVPAP